LEQTFNEIVRRHEALRRFGMVEEQLSSSDPPIEHTYPVLNLQELPADGREAEARRLITGVSASIRSVTRAIAAINVLKLDETEHVLLNLRTTLSLTIGL